MRKNYSTLELCLIMCYTSRKLLNPHVYPGTMLKSRIRNTQKYIALFPSNPNQTESEDDDVDSSRPKLKLPALLHPVPSAEECEKMDKPTKRRYDLLLETKKLMEEGKLKNEPETDLKKGQVDGVVVGLGADVEIGLEDKKKAKQNTAQGTGEEEDDFFESGDE